MTNVSGNHTRIDRKEDAIHDERLDDLISWAVDLSLQHINNFHILTRNLDSGIVDISIRGKTYVACMVILIHLGNLVYKICVWRLDTFHTLCYMDIYIRVLLMK